MLSEPPQSTLSTLRFEGVRLRHWVSGECSIPINTIYIHFFEGMLEIFACNQVSNPNQQYLHSVLKGSDWDIEWVGVVRYQSTISTFTFSRVYRNFFPLFEVSNPNQRYPHSILKGLDWNIWGCDQSQLTLSTFTFSKVCRKFVHVIRGFINNVSGGGTIKL